MSSWSTTARTSAPHPVVRWFYTRLAIYLAVALFSGLAFVAGVAIYAHLYPPVRVEVPAPQPTPVPAEPIRAPALKPPAIPQQPAALVATVVLPNGEKLPLAKILKQPVYDTKNEYVGIVIDALAGPNAQVNSLVVGFDSSPTWQTVSVPPTDYVAVPVSNFNVIVSSQSGIYVIIGDSRDELKSATKYRYNAEKKWWVPE